LFWQLVGDVLKVASLILGYQFFAKKLTVAFIVTELLSLSITLTSPVYSSLNLWARRDCNGMP
jgi:PST family polysaccharide transporter